MIGKTRQPLPDVNMPRGFLKRPAPAECIHHARHLAPPDLAPFIEHYWIVTWDMRGLPPANPQTLPHPSVHLVFERDAAEIYGIQTGKFSRLLEDQSHVFGIKFTPGGFYPILQQPLSTIANKVIPAESVFGVEGGPSIRDLTTILANTTNEVRMTEAATSFLRSLHLQLNEQAQQAGQLVYRILNTPEIMTVDHLVEIIGINKRSLQRLFSQYIGATPKWVIRRYRLHELVQRLESGRPDSGEAIDAAQLALDLGYFDQAHLINDFKSITNYTPTEYQNQLRKAAAL